MKTKNRGFTLVELLIVVAIIGFVVVGLFAGMKRCSRESNKGTATEAAKAWAAEMQIKDAIVSCTSQDSDGDGYVSCTVGQTLKTGELKATPLECEAAWTLNEGCRIPKAVLH